MWFCSGGLELDQANAHRADKGVDGGDKHRKQDSDDCADGHYAGAKLALFLYFLSNILGLIIYFVRNLFNHAGKLFEQSGILLAYEILGSESVQFAPQLANLGGLFGDLLLQIHDAQLPLAASMFVNEIKPIIASIHKMSNPS